MDSPKKILRAGDKWGMTERDVERRRERQTSGSRITFERVYETETKDT